MKGTLKKKKKIRTDNSLIHHQNTLPVSHTNHQQTLHHPLAISSLCGVQISYFFEKDYCTSPKREEKNNNLKIANELKKKKKKKKKKWEVMRNRVSKNGGVG